MNNSYSRFLKRLYSAVISRINWYYHYCRIAVIHFIAFCLRPYYAAKHYWILCERGVDAQDNAWHLLRYLRRKHPEINVRFAIRTCSNDYETNLADYKDVVVEYDSFKYYMILFNADVIATTHIQAYLYPHFLWGMVRDSVVDVKAKKVFLQHGVIRHKIGAFDYPQFKVDMFVCSTPIEYDILTKMQHQPETIAQRTGLPRFDNLYDCNLINQILVMPTWRIQFSTLSESEFEESPFFQNYKSILTDERLLAKLEEKNCDIAYYNHFEFQKFNNCFKKLESKHVRLLQFGQKRVQELLRESKALVTDFSSIYYDFLYMGKPIVFMGADEETFSSTQYGKRYDGNLADFGYSEKTPNGVVDSLIKLLDYDFALEEKYHLQQQKMFPDKDRNNCERVYQSIEKLLVQ